MTALDTSKHTMGGTLGRETTYAPPLGALAWAAVGCVLLAWVIGGGVGWMTGGLWGVTSAGIGASIAGVGAVGGLLVFGLLGRRPVITWSMVIVGESSGRLAMTACLAAVVYTATSPERGSFWLAYLLASLALLACWTGRLRGDLMSATTDVSEESA